MKRWKFLLVSLGLVMLLAAPLFGAGEAEQETEPKLVVYHWWTAGGEKEAIDALFEAFNEHYPEIEIIENPVSGGGGGVLRGQIKTMVMAGQAPDTFQLTYGTGMLGSFAEILEPIDEFFVDFPVPDMVKEMGTVNGHPVSVPLNIMRNNCLWYNMDLVEEIGIDMPIETPQEFLEACEMAKDAGYTPLAVGAGGGQQFWWGQITEQMIVGAPHGGIEYLNKLYSGEADPSNDRAIREMLSFVSTLLRKGYINDDYSALTWDQAGDLLMRDEAVFYSMGDWVKGHFTSAGWEPKVDFDYQPNPGTDGSFTLHFDGFSLCNDAPHPDAVMKWLEFLTTVEAENTFCPIKGATPPRLDALTDMYDEISQDILADFRDPDTKIGQSIFAQPPEQYLGVYGSMFSDFAENPDVDRGVRLYAEAYERVFGL